jgi:hypothetical protein
MLRQNFQVGWLVLREDKERGKDPILEIIYGEVAR